MSTTSLLRRTRLYLRELLTNLYFWGGLAVLTLVLTGILLLFNAWIMPGLTRHSVAVNVPDVRQQPFEEAARILRAYDLHPETEVQRFNPNLPRDVVVDQNPVPNTSVKPGRHIYLTLNSGTAPTVQVPSVNGLSLREAKNRIISVGLQVEKTLPDSIPAPHPNTVTRQDPRPSTVVPQGSSVSLWYSTGLGEAYVNIPNVTGLTIDVAKRLLLEQKLRGEVIGEVEDAATQQVMRQSQPAGTRVREGFEVRLFLQE